MGMYQWLLLLHIVAVMVWWGGALVGTVLGMSIRSSGDGPAMGRFCTSFASVAGPMFGGTAFLALLSGIGMVAMDGGPSFSDLWITIGFAGWIVTAVFGATLLGRAWLNVGVALTDGASLDDQRAAIATATRYSWLDLGARLAIIIVMVWKPA